MALVNNSRFCRRHALKKSMTLIYSHDYKNENNDYKNGNNDYNEESL